MCVCVGFKTLGTHDVVQRLSYLFYNLISFKLYYERDIGRGVFDLNLNSKSSNYIQY